MYFDELSKEHRFYVRTRLGNYVAHKLVNGTGGLASVEELNKIDRYDAAYEWYCNETKDPWRAKRLYQIEQEHPGNQEGFLCDVALYLDERIPKAYKKIYTHSERPAEQQKIEVDSHGNVEFGFRYAFEQHYKAVAFPNAATDKQIAYLRSLSSKHRYRFLNQEQMGKYEAHLCIEYFLNMDYLSEPECFSNYFRM